MTATLFDGDDAAYLRWLAEHADGFVVNLRRRFDSEYVVLHRARCPSVNRYRGIDKNPGGFTERNYLKLCATSVPALDGGLRRLFGEAAAFSSACSMCKPL